MCNLEPAKHPRFHHCAVMSVTCGVQGTGQILSNNYEGLDAADMDAPPPPHQYSGLGVHAPGPPMDQHGYLVVVGDPKYGEHPQVSTDIIGYLSHIAKNRKRQISTQKPLNRFRRNMELVSSTTHVVVSDNVYTKMNTTSASPPT